MMRVHSLHRVYRRVLRITLDHLRKKHRLRSPAPRVCSFLSTPLTRLSSSHSPYPTFLPPFPPAQPHHQTSSIIAFPTNLCSKAHDIPCAFIRGLRFLDNIHNLLIIQSPADAIRYQDDKRIFCGAELDAPDFWLG